MSYGNTQDKTGFPRKTSVNSVDKAGRPDGTQHPDLSKRMDGSTHVKAKRSVNSESRGGRPAGNDLQPKHHHSKLSGSQKGTVTDVSAGRVKRGG